MKPYRIALLYLVMLFVNYFVIKVCFMGMTAPNDFSFMGGVLFLVLLVIFDVRFVLWRVKKAMPQVEGKENTNA